jgi:ATP/maltotriose-dependent transcriptional regulator MalT
MSSRTHEAGPRRSALADPTRPGPCSRLLLMLTTMNHHHFGSPMGKACFEAAAALLRLARIQFHAGDAADAHALIGQAKDLLGKSQAPGVLTGLLDEAERLAGPVAPAAAPRSHGRVRRPDGLTAREAEVLGLLAGGNSNDEIAAELVISVYTVVRHLQNAYRKIGVRNRAQAAAYMVLNG